MQQGTSVNRYNGDGALVQSDQVAYTQDLASSLSKVLQIHDGTHRTNYIYGHERLLSDAAGGEWYATDALGSLRFTLNDDGLATSGTTYDPFGQRERGTIATFGFTGELQDANSDNVYLRARWYNPSHGAFMAQDPFSGFDQQPYSLHPYQYGYSAPTTWTDPSGMCVHWIGDAVGQLFGNAPTSECKYQGWSNPNWEDGAALVEGVASNVTDTIVGVYTLATDSNVREAAWEGIKNTRPSDIPGMVINGITEPFQNIYQGFLCDDSYLIGKGLGGAGLQLLEIASIAKTIKALNGVKTPLVSTGARYGKYRNQLDRWERYAPQAYASIRQTSSDIVEIARNTGISADIITKIKNHLFYNKHRLDRGIDYFDPDPDIADAWDRLIEGDYIQEDLDLLAHELYEAEFELIHNTDYRTAHNAAIEAGFTWDAPEVP